MKTPAIILAVCVAWCAGQFVDEMQTYEAECLGEDKFPCSSGGCIYQTQYCDGSIDCEDGSDEYFCPHKADVALCNETNQYMCADQKWCIPNMWLCDGERNCDDGSDEANCTALPAPVLNNGSCKGFVCSDGKCISNLWVCDGVYDCSDKGDEVYEVCRHVSLPHAILDGSYCHELPVFGDRSYRCLDSSYCLPAHLMCDGMPDCRDGSDEGSFCEHWHTMCDTHSCHGNNTQCTPERYGPTCLCQRSSALKRYNVATQTCDDVNECLLARPECSHTCINGDGHFFCECDFGYTKDQFGYLCYAKGAEAMLFFSTRNEIKYLKIKSKQVVSVATGVKEAHGVSFDGTYLYWVETAQGHQSIFKAQLDDIKDTKQVLVGLGLEDPGDIAVDWLGGNIYFSDAERGIISACRADGSICTTIKTQSRHPRFVTLDARNGMMYWADWHQRPVIMSARMDGSDPQLLVDNMKSIATGLAMDAPNSRLYYVDGTVKVVTLLGKHVYSLFEERFHHPYSIAVFENTVFWSDWTSNSIQTIDKLHRRAQNRNLLLSLDVPVMGMHMYHPALMNSTVNPCRGNNCSHICLVTSNSTYVCGCPDTMAMRQNACYDKPNYRPKYLVVAGGELFTRIQYDSLGNPEGHATHFNIGRVQAMAYDSLRDVLYIYDGQRKTINYINMSDFTLGLTHLIVYHGLENVLDMDYDYVTDSLYILDAGRRLVEVISLRTQKRALLYRFEDMETPISFCVLPDIGRMLVAVVENELHNNIHIDSIGLDGEGRKHVIMNNLKGPHVRLRYVPHMENVYISDEGNGAIDFMHPEGTGRENYRELSTTVTSLAIADHYVFWTDRRTSRLFWSDIHETTQKIRRIDLAIFPTNTQLLIQATTHYPDHTDPLLTHPCLTQNPCSDVCIQTPHPHPHESHLTMGYKCLCPPGLVLSGGLCLKVASCGDQELLCHRSNVCFNKSGRCDGKRDCPHGEDEEGCISVDITNICSDDEIYCNGVCIHKDKSISCNEQHIYISPVVNVCTNTEFQCANSSICIARSLACDGHADCPDGSDERAADCDTLACFESEFMCASGSCILKTWTCDGDEDCNDGSDEVDCVNLTCGPGFYQCRNKACIELKKRCDGQPDCFDFSDEEECEETPFIEFSEETPRCAEWEYACELNKSICLPHKAKCNMKVDCPGGTDESGCEDLCAPKGKFACKQQFVCVPMRRVCNGKNDCVDGSDETPDACAVVNKTSRLYPSPVRSSSECTDGFMCRSGQCLEWQQVCDGHHDCFDGSDENGLCSTACLNNTCEFLCQATPLRPICLCPVGYQADINQNKCLDVDECVNEVCSQSCLNVPGSYLCSCHYGYALRSDRRSCKARRGNMSVLYVSGNSVRSVAADGSGAMLYSDSDVGAINDMDYHVRKNLLYVSSTAAGKLIEVNSTGSVVTVTNVGRPTRVAVDWVTGNVYFVDSSPTLSCIRVCNVRRKRCARLQKLPSDAKVTALIVDPSSRRMFYCVTRELESVVWSASLAGRNISDITTVRNCTGLAVDTFRKKLYVAETGPAHIIRMDYEGESHKKILADHPQLQAPHGLSIFEDHIYYLVANSFRLSRCQLFGPTHCETYIYRVFDANTFVIRHESVQRDDLKNDCDGHSCSNICALDETGPICICNDGVVEKNGECTLLDQKELPLFNGWTYQDYIGAHHASFTVIIAVMILFALYLCVFIYYHFVYKPRKSRASAYTEVRFQNTATDTATYPCNPTVQMTTEGGIAHEFVNPLQYVRNMWYGSFRKHSRPNYSSSLNIQNSPVQQDLSDTESDLDERDNKRFFRKK